MGVGDVGGGLLLWGTKKVKVLFRGLIEIYLSCYNLILQFFLAITYLMLQRRKRLRTVVSMTSCGALERSNNPYMESIVEPCVSKNQKEIFVMWV